MPEVIVKEGFDSRHWNVGDHVEIDEGARLDDLLAKGWVELVNPPAPKEEETPIIEEVVEVEEKPQRGRPKKE